MIVWPRALSLLVVLMAGGNSLLLGCRAEVTSAPVAEPIAVRCVHPVRGPLDSSVLLRGHLAPPPGGTLEVAAQVSGRVVEISVHEGQVVEPGQQLALIDDPTGRDALRQSSASTSQAAAALNSAELTLARVQALVERGIAARQELEQARAQVDSAQAAAASARAAADLARVTAGRVVVHSTLRGVVTRVLRGKGALVDGTAATPLLQLARSDALEFSAAVNQTDLQRLAIGQAASGSLLAGALTEAMLGQVTALPSELDPTTGLGTVRIALMTQPTHALVGSYAQMRVALPRDEHALLIPNAALRGAVSDASEVFVCKQGVAIATPVQIGQHNAEQAEVLAGLSESDWIAVEHVLGLQPDAPIRELKP